MANILSDNEFLLDDFNPHAIAREMATRLKKRRLALKLTQQALAAKAGVSLGSLKRFEHQYEISLKHLLQLAVVLDATEEFSALFPPPKLNSIDEVLKAANDKQPKRGTRNA
jgi:transcriptional regulator with XRE-family HTH domain